MAADRHMDSDMAIASGDTLRRMELITGVGRRRRWTREQKARIVAESFESTGTVSDIARRHGMNPGLLFLWRRQAREGVEAPNGLMPFVPVEVDNGVAEDEPVQAPSSVSSMIEIEVAEARIKLSGPVDQAALAAVLAAVRRRP
jgi:transposase